MKWTIGSIHILFPQMAVTIKFDKMTWEILSFMVKTWALLDTFLGISLFAGPDIRTYNECQNPPDGITQFYAQQ